jgi:hypothetical protein
MRRALTAAAATLALALGGCGGDDAGGFTPADDLLQPADLPDEPATTVATDQPPAIAAWCAGRLEAIYGPAFETTGVEYDDVDGATIVSTLGREPSATLDRQRLALVADTVSGCAETSPQQGLQTIDLGSGRVGFEAPADDASQAPAGRIGIAAVDDAYVLVAVVADLDAETPDLAQLLDAAVARAADGPS